MVLPLLAWGAIAAAGALGSAAVGYTLKDDGDQVTNASYTTQNIKKTTFSTNVVDFRNAKNSKLNINQEFTDTFEPVASTAQEGTSKTDGLINDKTILLVAAGAAGFFVLKEVLK